MSLDEYGPPKGAYYSPALEAIFADEAAASDALAELRAEGFQTRDIDVARSEQGVTVIVSEPSPGMLERARAVLEASSALTVRPYGSGLDAI
ncbi:MAG TPA: hypothetical protein VFE42_19300 [Chloroflexota bacterium]|nr:hypothetical protein [Chloroflexota bacterium]